MEFVDLTDTDASVDLLFFYQFLIPRRTQVHLVKSFPTSAKIVVDTAEDSAVIASPHLAENGPVRA